MSSQDFINHTDSKLLNVGGSGAHLVLDERQEGRDDQGAAALQQGRQLVAEGLAATGRHEAHHISALHGGIYHLLLLRPASGG